MDQKCFVTPSYHHLLIKSYYFLFFSHLTQIAFSSVDPKFQSCQPQSCGNGPNITFPFYIRERKLDFCGFPRFDVFCGVNNYPILNLSNNHYIIHEIFYNNDSLRVSDPAFLSSNSTNCFPRTKNLRLQGNRFDLVPSQTDLFLLFGCDLESLPQRLNSYRIGCSGENNSIERRSVLGFHGNGSDLMDAVGSNKCENGTVKATVEDTKEGALGALRRGFLLKWTATNCSTCEKSGGKCGFNWDLFSFQCYCPDGPQSWNCGSG